MPYIGFGTAGSSYWGFLRDMILGVPATLRPVYQEALAKASDPDAARIDVSKIRGRLLMFAGDADAMWQADEASTAITKERPERTEAHIYPGAGHAFYLKGAHYGGMDLGGTADANAAAAEASRQVLAERLAVWTA